MADSRDSMTAPGPHRVSTVDVRDGSVVGVLAAPVGVASPPCVIVLPGSGGGIPAPFAVELASEGFLTLALAYFGTAWLPPDLVEVPLEVLREGVAWLRSKSSLPQGRVGIVGQSKGSEYALVAASLLPDKLAVVAYVPSNVCWPGISRWDPSQPPRGSWSYNGAILPFLPYTITSEFEAENASGRPLRLTLLYDASLDTMPSGSEAEIAVEDVKGPVMLISGTDDQMWPSQRMADAIMARLDRKGFPFEHEHLAYAGAGHFSGPPSFSTSGSSGGPFDLGGSAEANAAAREDSWPRVIDFLRRNLATP